MNWGGKKRPQQFRLITTPTPKLIIFWSVYWSVPFVLHFFKTITIVTFSSFSWNAFFPPSRSKFVTQNMYAITGIIKLADRFPFQFSSSFAHKFLNSFHLKWNGLCLISAFDFTYCENKTASKKFNLNVWNLKEQNQTSLFPMVAMLNHTINMIALPEQYSWEKKDCVLYIRFESYL